MKTNLIGAAGVLGLGLAMAACHSANGSGTGGSSTSSSSVGSGGASTCPFAAPTSSTDSLALTLTGTLDGATFNDLFTLDTAGGGDGVEINAYSRPSCGGAAFVLSPATGYASSPDGGTCAADGAICTSSIPCCNDNCNEGACSGPPNYVGLFRLPAGGSDGGEWFCAGPGTTATDDPSAGIDFVLSSITKLGACPGTPVSGSVDVCLGTDLGGNMVACSGNRTTITSTLSGASFAWNNPAETMSAGNLNGPQTVFTVGFASPPQTKDGAGSELLIEYGGLAGLGGLNGSGKVTGGVLLIGPGNPDAGAVYCISGGTAVQPADQETYQFTLTGLSRLGTCAGAAGAGSLTGHVSP